MLNLRKPTNGHKLSQNVDGCEWEHKIPAEDDFTGAQIQPTQYQEAQNTLTRSKKNMRKEKYHR